MEVEENSEIAATDLAMKKESTLNNNQPLKIDFNELFGPSPDEPTEDIVVVRTKRKRRREKERKSEIESSEKNEDTSYAEDLSGVSDHELRMKIERFHHNLKTVASRLPDKGEKIRARAKFFQEELDRRQLRHQQEIAKGCEKPVYSGNSNINGSFDGPKQAVQPNQSSTTSKFASCFLKKLEDNNPKHEHSSNQASNAFASEFLHLNRCDKSKMKSLDKIRQGKRANPSLGLKGFCAWKSRDRSPCKGGKYMHLNGKQAGKVLSIGSLPLQRDKIADSKTDKVDSQALNSSGLEIEKTVVVVDEEDPELFERKEANDLPSRPNEGRIYYPSREDPESLEIFRSELKCLEPGECLTSTIMNFYIRYLQDVCSPADSPQRNFYFFNTYFYSKLQEAVGFQKSDKEAFLKFRRWWKGVNIFQKAYILLPINEDNHWSLVIIFIPGEEDESGPTILHLDSLGLHSSSSIFNNIKSLLKKEWEILNEDDGAVKVPIPDRIWEHLPRRIEQREIVVPRQTNDYDCGLFVLYYMERFIQEAPRRLTRKQLQESPMFGKNWFKPRDASSLRGKIKKILQDKFYTASDKCTWEPVSLSSKVEIQPVTLSSKAEIQPVSLSSKDEIQPVSLSSKAETTKSTDETEIS